MPNYYQIKRDNTKNMFMDILLTFTQKCWERLHKLGLSNSVFNDNGNESIFKSSLDILNPKCWIPAVVPGKSTIYTCKNETFRVCQPQQNFQLLTEARGCCKHFCKYISKIDKQNYINILMNNEKKVLYASSSTYIRNKKRTSYNTQ